jgi:hypothetical protein
VRRFDLLVAVIACCSPAPGAPALPAPTGTYAIGRVSYAVGKAMVHVWYPADEKANKGKVVAPYMPGFDEVRPKLSDADIADLFRPAVYTGPESLPETHFIENARMPAGRTKYPLLVFSHGWGNPTYLYTAEIEDIVSHGYIVAAIDHPGDSAWVRFPDGRLTLFAQQAFDAAAQKPRGLNDYAKARTEAMTEDNSAALTEILRLANTRTLHAPFQGRIDKRKIGALGHSIGGLTAARSCQTDPRLKACMDQDSADNRGSPFIVSGLDQTERQPFFLFVAASADVWSQRALNPDDAELAQQKLARPEFNAIMKQQQENQTKQLASIPGGSYRLMLFDLPGFSHRSFTDQTLLATAIDHEEALHNFQVAQAYTLAFFDKHLKGDTKTILDKGERVDNRARLEKFPGHRR